MRPCVADRHRGNRVLRASGPVGLGLLGMLGTASLPAGATEITGAGSSFGAPIYGAWGEGISHVTDIRLNYQTIGSGAGQNQVKARTVDFGASDAPMNAAQLAQNGLLQFPTVLGAIVLVVNLPGVETSHMHLTGDLLARLYAGDITQWNDPRIVAENPDMTLPAMPVAPVRRADGSGTTFVFTSYLSRVSPRWAAEEGRGTSIEWPAGEGARGNDGVAAAVRNTEGSIGYLEYAYAAGNHMPMVELRNRHGDLVTADPESFRLAVTTARWAQDATHSADVLDGEGAGAWPIMAATYVLVPMDRAMTAQGRAVRAFFDWSMQHGGDAALALGYVPLPDSISASIRELVNAR
ncbi:phosphate ABC transporter substrate-binding protein PstS [Komagataeibacter sp. FNDCR2]|uniref:phosphate ABC transporter substrate-binding protein PstS n=1 Tax=Komagataeibacter sp. FNDCR2 TaxID=2878682 RepID=UPI001E6324CA|nr:phosphate ABC transporter substrate-binding protein PstS [Komagataeibacter sp. FNDCR2]MCE2574589.1 phosphate ABC transporter substrate-binding protein PstS [Komagataeibacter sp. FNDCR2]